MASQSLWPKAVVSLLLCPKVVISLFLCLKVVIGLFFNGGPMHLHGWSSARSSLASSAAVVPWWLLAPFLGESWEGGHHVGVPESHPTYQSDYSFAGGNSSGFQVQSSYSSSHSQYTRFLPSYLVRRCGRDWLVPQPSVRNNLVLCHGRASSPGVHQISLGTSVHFSCWHCYLFWGELLQLQSG